MASQKPSEKKSVSTKSSGYSCDGKRSRPTAVFQQCGGGVRILRKRIGND